MSMMMMMMMMAKAKRPRICKNEIVCVASGIVLV